MPLPPRRHRSAVARDHDVRRVRRITRAVAALAVAGTAGVAGLAAAAHADGTASSTATAATAANAAGAADGAGVTRESPSAAADTVILEDDDVTSGAAGQHLSAPVVVAPAPTVQAPVASSGGS